jgi:iron-sulfur cluster repair protein YtfE (RIC family)
MSRPRSTARPVIRSDAQAVREPMAALLARHLRASVGMDANTARNLLLSQHEAIRASMAECVGLAKRVRVNEASEAELEFALELMRAKVYEHNLTESEVIRPLLASTQRWGDLLIDRMIEEHLAEHVAMWTVLNQPAIVVALELDTLAEDLDAHMAAEERTFIAVLRPDVISNHRK